MQLAKLIRPVLFLLSTFLFAGYDQAQSFTPLFSFNSANGAFPAGGVILDSAGNVYGTTEFAGGTGAGNVFKIDPAGNETILFQYTLGPDGGHPRGSLVRDSSGNLYGTARDGGDTNCFFPGQTSGCGVIYKLDPSGHQTILHTFTGAPDGAAPDAGLIRDSAGNLYGTTEFGGNPSCPQGEGHGCGTVFKLDSACNLTTLHSFAGPEGASPMCALLRDSTGNLYGTASGGAFSGGVLFKLSPSGKLTVIHNFGHSHDGSGPVAGVIRDSAGNFYGTTTGGGSSFFGTVYKVTSTGKETVLHSFTNRQDEGQNPFGGLVRDPSGSLFGTTASGGDLHSCAFAVPGCGTIFKLDPTGKETILHLFENGADGATPLGTLIEDSTGNLYGTAANGGQNGFGVVFKFTP